jgi:hypothetical protein
MKRTHVRTRREKKKIIKKEIRRPTDRKWGLVLPCSVWNRCTPSGPTEISVPLATMDDASKLILTCHIANRPVGFSIGRLGLRQSVGHFLHTAHDLQRHISIGIDPKPKSIHACIVRRGFGLFGAYRMDI